MQAINVNKQPAADNAQYRFDYLPLYEDTDLFRYISIYQVGDLCTKPGFRIGHHVQHYHEISYVESGSGHFCINGQWLPVKAGDLVIVRSGDTHDGVADEGVSMRIFYLVFKIQDNARAIAPYSDILSLYESGIGARRICHGHREIVPFFDGLFNEIARRESFYGSFMEAYALQLLLAICRAFADSNLNSSGDCTADAKELMVHEIIRYIDANIENIDNLCDLTKVFKYSYSYLSHIFRNKMDMSLFQYYDKKRFDWASALLQEGRLSITEVADKLGYQSLPAFSKAFSKRFGISPSEYALMSQSAGGYAPIYEQGKMLIMASQSGSNITSFVQGNLFFCAGLCIERISNCKPQIQPQNSQSVHRVGHSYEDPYDSEYV